MLEESAPATRSELLATRARVRLARQGRDLLEDRRAELLKAFHAVAWRILEAEAALERSAAEARSFLEEAEAVEGQESVRSAAWAAHGNVPVEARVVSLMGVPVPDVVPGRAGRPLDGRGYGVQSTSSRLDEAARRFEVEVEGILEVASGERRLQVLAGEIGRTTRRVNALEQVLIPRLEARGARIRRTLDEREREDRFRLRRFSRCRREP